MIQVTDSDGQRARETALLVCGAVLEAIKEAGPQGLPSGHLYAALCGKLSLENYQAIIEILTRLGKIRNSNHLLTAIV